MARSKATARRIGGKAARKRKPVTAEEVGAKHHEIEFDDGDACQFKSSRVRTLAPEELRKARHVRKRSSRVRPETFTLHQDIQDSQQFLELSRDPGITIVTTFDNVPSQVSAAVKQVSPDDSSSSSSSNSGQAASNFVTNRNDEEKWIVRRRKKLKTGLEFAPIGCSAPTAVQVTSPVKMSPQSNFTPLSPVQKQQHPTSPSRTTWAPFTFSKHVSKPFSQPRNLSFSSRFKKAPASPSTSTTAPSDHHHPHRSNENAPPFVP